MIHYIANQLMKAWVVIDMGRRAWPTENGCCIGAPHFNMWLHKDSNFTNVMIIFLTFLRVLLIPNALVEDKHYSRFNTLVNLIVNTNENATRNGKVISIRDKDGNMTYMMGIE